MVLLQQFLFLCCGFTAHGLLYYSALYSATVIKIFMRNKIKQLVLLSLLFTTAFAVVKIDNSRGDEIIGTIRTAQLQQDQTFIDFIRKNDIGYDEFLHANPNVNPDNVNEGDIFIIPTSHIVLAKYKSHILVNLAERRLYSFINPKKIMTYPVGIGKIGWGTPMGTMKIIGKRSNPSWYVPKSVLEESLAEGVALPDVVAPGPDNPLGKYAMRLSMPSYLIHGTNDPSGIGARSTSGCISMYPEDIKSLFKKAKISTPVKIINEPLKWYLEKNKLCLEMHSEPYMDDYDESFLNNKINMSLDKLRTMADISLEDSNFLHEVTTEKLGIPECITIGA